MGRFNRQKALELGVPEGPLFSKLHKGESVVVEGREIKSSAVVGEARPGRLVVYTGDTAPSHTFLSVLANADLWISEGTFADDAADKAAETQHSTVGDVARLAVTAGVQRLIFTHVSSRYSEDREHLLEDARRHFPEAIVAEDFLEFEVPLKESQ